MKWDIWWSAICHFPSSPPTHAVNNLNQQRNEQSRKISPSQLCTCAHTHNHTNSHQTSPVDTGKRQLLAVTTLLLSVIQSIITSLSPLLLSIVALLSHNSVFPLFQALFELLTFSNKMVKEGVEM